jgi:YbbR domain-containing protein
MPYQDIDEPVAEKGSSPSPVEQWLHKVFIEDWSLKVLALTISLVLWVAVTGVNKPVTIRTGVPLNIIRPDDLEISNDPPKSIDVFLTGSQTRLERINFLNLVATVNLGDFGAGERIIRLSQDRVDINLPEGVKIESFQPSTLTVRLEARAERRLDVDVKLEGKPAEGYEVYETRLSPGSIRARGPASNINSLSKAPTETISVEGRTETFTVPHVAIAITDHKVDILDPVVDVTVVLGPRRASEILK